MKYYAPKVWPNWSLNPWHPEHGQYISCTWDTVILITLHIHLFYIMCRTGQDLFQLLMTVGAGEAQTCFYPHMSCLLYHCVTDLILSCVPLRFSFQGLVQWLASWIYLRTEPGTEETPWKGPLCGRGDVITLLWLRTWGILRGYPRCRVPDAVYEWRGLWHADCWRMWRKEWRRIKRDNYSNV